MATTKAKPFNEMQIYLLKFFSRNPSKKEMEDIQRLIANYYAEKAKAGIKKVCKEKNYTAATFKSMTNQSLRAMKE